MTLLWEHFRLVFLGLARSPAYVVGTIALPGLILLFLGPGLADSPPAANAIMASFAVFGMMGIAFFQFGVGIAQDRVSPWSTFERVLAAPSGARFGGRILAAVAFAAGAVGVVAAVALSTMPVEISAVAWLRLGAVLVVGCVPLSLLGIAIGYWCSPRAALPVANIVNLALAFGGGLFLRPRSLPPLMNDISALLPSRHIAELAWAAVADAPWTADHWLWIGLYAVAAAFVAGLGYRRDEGQRFR